MESPWKDGRILSRGGRSNNINRGIPSNDQSHPLSGGSTIAWGARQSLGVIADHGNRNVRDDAKRLPSSICNRGVFYFLHSAAFDARLPSP
jgi:hypothetical protein